MGTGVLHVFASSFESVEHNGCPPPPERNTVKREPFLRYLLREMKTLIGIRTAQNLSNAKRIREIFAAEKVHRGALGRHQALLWRIRCEVTGDR